MPGLRLPGLPGCGARLAGLPGCDAVWLGLPGLPGCDAVWLGLLGLPGCDAVRLGLPGLPGCDHAVRLCRGLGCRAVITPCGLDCRGSGCRAVITPCGSDCRGLGCRAVITPCGYAGAQLAGAVLPWSACCAAKPRLSSPSCDDLVSTPCGYALGMPGSDCRATTSGLGTLGCDAVVRNAILV